MFKKINRENKKGFTLAELLIVVAIIAVLVAVSIPIFTSQLEKSREATDVANMRAAKAAAVTAYLSEDAPVWTKTAAEGSTPASTTFNGTVYYDANNGVLKADKTDITPYGKGTSVDGGNKELGYTNADYTGKVIKVTITQASGEVSLTWE